MAEAFLTLNISYYAHREEENVLVTIVSEDGRKKLVLDKERTAVWRQTEERYSGALELKVYKDPPRLEILNKTVMKSIILRIIRSEPLGNLSINDGLRGFPHDETILFVRIMPDNTLQQFRIAFKSRKGFKSAKQVCEMFVKECSNVIKFDHQLPPSWSEAPKSDEAEESFLKLYVNPDFDSTTLTPLHQMDMPKDKLKNMIEATLKDPSFPSLIASVEEYLRQDIRSE